MSTTRPRHLTLAAACLMVAFAALSQGCGKSHTNGDAATQRDQRVDGTACSQHADCVVVPQSCCGRCGSALAGDAVALHRDDVSAHQALACAGNSGCPECFQATPPTLIASCIASQCRLTDLQTSDALTACDSADDCRPRMTQCCECGGTYGMDNTVAISGSGFPELVCEPETPCLACQPLPPPTLQVTCEGGHCATVWAIP